MTKLGEEMIRATVAMQAAVLERENEDVALMHSFRSIETIAKQIAKLSKQISKEDQ